ncbi:MAG: hypothetical protein RR363_00170, partial [Rikenellaceae bacterium]
MEIKAADVAKLRKMTGAGMMDCKKALTDAAGDFEKAKDIIREKGKMIANKRADRDASEGYMSSKIIGNKGVILQYFKFTQVGSVAGYATVKVLKTNSVTKENLKLYYINKT